MSYLLSSKDFSRLTKYIQIWVGSRSDSASSSRFHDPPAPPVASRSVSGTKRRAPPAAGTPQRPSHLGQRPRPWPPPSRTPLTRVSLTLGSALIKLAEGREVREEVSPAIGVVAPAALERVLWVRSPEDRLFESRTAGRPVPSSRIYVGAEAPVSPGCPSVLRFLRTGKLTADLFPQGTREGACRKSLSFPPKSK
ncbi:hypothetical protein Cgig2_021901 [Carnegiea gigantea]|uniref:Uncharacterized protein n=1 Tax=Carnegiea gigantea TaxID=171969 RepID=A0A9Q1JWL7_9CARY|nr:hypothetical protein Cgig2_021901 [Carnegiea gigantea]